MPEMEKKAKQILLHSFDKLFKAKGEFLNIFCSLPIDKCIDVLNDDNLNVESEATVKDTIKQYINIRESIKEETPTKGKTDKQEKKTEKKEGSADKDKENSEKKEENKKEDENNESKQSEDKKRRK